MAKDRPKNIKYMQSMHHSYLNLHHGIILSLLSLLSTYKWQDGIMYKINYITPIVENAVIYVIYLSLTFGL